MSEDNLKDDILNRLDSENNNIIEHSLQMINERLAVEQERSKSGESRANTLLGFSGAAAATILAMSKLLIENDNQSNLRTMLYFQYFVVLIFIWKAMWYAMQSTRTELAKRLTPDLIYDIQKMDMIDALKYEIKWKLWEYGQSKQRNTEKLFRLNRAQRNLILAIFFILMMSIVTVVNGFESWNTSPCALLLLECVLGTSGLVFSLFCDPILDRIEIWHFNPT